MSEVAPAGQRTYGGSGGRGLGRADRRPHTARGRPVVDSAGTAGRRPPDGARGPRDGSQGGWSM